MTKLLFRNYIFRYYKRTLRRNRRHCGKIVELLHIFIYQTTWAKTRTLVYTLLIC